MHFKWLGCVVMAASSVTAFGLVNDVRAFGAKGDGKTKDTAAIQKAIDDCAAKGGGTVKLAGGVFLSGPILLKSHVTLDLPRTRRCWARLT